MTTYRLKFVPQTAIPRAVALGVVMVSDQPGAQRVATNLPTLAMPTTPRAGIRSGNVTLWPDGIIPPAVNLGVQMYNPAVAPIVPVPIIVPLVTGCVAVLGFTWSQFADDLSLANIEATLSNNDNAQLNIRLGGPLAAWQHYSFDGRIAGHPNLGIGGELRIPFAIKLTNGQPDFDNITPPRPDLIAVPAYAAMMAFANADNVSFDASAFVDGLAQFPGVATDGFGQSYWQAYSIVDPVWFETWYSLVRAGPKGYPGYWWFYNNGNTNFDAFGSGYANLDEFRAGFIDVASTINDEAFDGSTMRVGVWAVRNGAVYDVRIIDNGVITHTESVPATDGVFRITWNPTLLDPPANGAEDGQLSVQHELNFETDTDSWSYFPDPEDATIIPGGCLKYAQYARPNPANTIAGEFDFYQQYNMITDPAYPL